MLDLLSYMVHFSHDLRASNFFLISPQSFFVSVSRYNSIDAGSGFNIVANCSTALTCWRNWMRHATWSFRDLTFMRSASSGIYPKFWWVLSACQELPTISGLCQKFCYSGVRHGNKIANIWFKYPNRYTKLTSKFIPTDLQLIDWHGHRHNFPENCSQFTIQSICSQLERRRRHSNGAIVKTNKL